MLIQTFLLAAACTLAVASPLSARAPTDISGCKPSVEWEFKLNGDAKDSGDLKQHPAWNKKFDTACGCADAVLNAPGPAAIMFVWNSVTKGCYPKGIYRIPSGEYESATLLLPYVTADPDAAKTYTVGNSGRIAAKKCLNLNMGYNQDNFDKACGSMVGANDYEFGIYRYNQKFQATCSLCHFDDATGQVLGYRAPGNIPSVIFP